MPRAPLSAAVKQGSQFTGSQGEGLRWQPGRLSGQLDKKETEEQSRRGMLLQPWVCYISDSPPAELASGCRELKPKHSNLVK